MSSAHWRLFRLGLNVLNASIGLVAEAVLQENISDFSW